MFGYLMLEISKSTETQSPTAHMPNARELGRERLGLGRMAFKGTVNTPSAI